MRSVSNVVLGWCEPVATRRKDRADDCSVAILDQAHDTGSDGQATK